MGRLRRIGLVLLVLAVAVVAWEPTRVGLQTAVLLPNLLDAGPKPLSLFSEAPRRTAVEYRPGPEGGAPELAELWLPSWATADRKAGAMLLVLGVNNVGRNHPVVDRVADALARTGVAVLVPDSRVLLEGRLEVGEVDGVVRAFELLASRPEVDPQRVGIVGFSVGGSLALLAAADPRIADRVRFVNAFGAFGDASTYLASVAAHAYRDESGREVPWTPSPLAREIYLRFMLDQVADAGDRRALEGALGERRARRRQAAAGPGAAGVARDRCRSNDPRPADRRVAGGCGAGDRRAAGGEPGVHRRRSRRCVMSTGCERTCTSCTTRRTITCRSSSRGRWHRPWTDAGILRAHTEFRLFDHVQPDDVDFIAAAPELVKLLLHVRTLLEETL